MSWIPEAIAFVSALIAAWAAGTALGKRGALAQLRRETSEKQAAVTSGAAPARSSGVEDVWWDKEVGRYFGTYVLYDKVWTFWSDRNAISWYSLEDNPWRGGAAGSEWTGGNSLFWAFLRQRDITERLDRAHERDMAEERARLLKAAQGAQ